MLGFAIITPYMGMSRWAQILLPPSQHRPVNSTWYVYASFDLILNADLVSMRRYSLFELISAWANTGMSLVDQNLVPFQRAYLLLIAVIVVALLGGTGFVSEAACLVRKVAHCPPP